MNIICMFVVAVFAYGVVGSEFQECDLKVYKNNSDTRDWFKVTFDPKERNAKEVQRIIYGNGWVSSRNDPEVVKEKSFDGNRDKNQIIYIEAEDGSDFSVEKVGIKSTNSDNVTLSGLSSGGDVVFSKSKEPKLFNVEDFPKWKRVIFHRRDNVVSKLKLDIKLQYHMEDDPRGASHLLFLRGLIVQVCEK